MKIKKSKCIISLPEVTTLFFFVAILASLLVPGINQAKLNGGIESEMILPEFPPFNPTNEWPQWARVGFVPLSGFISAGVGTLCFWLFHYLLPEKLKLYFPLKKTNFVD